MAERPSPAAGLRLLEQCLTFEPTDPLVLSELLSCVSALFVFLSMAPSTHLLTSVKYLCLPNHITFILVVPSVMYAFPFTGPEQDLCCSCIFRARSASGIAKQRCQICA